MKNNSRCNLLFVLIIMTLFFTQYQAMAQDQGTTKTKSPTVKQVIDTGVEQLLKIQNDDGAWPYQGVYRVRGKIPVGYRIGGTAICCEALLYATDANNKNANKAIERGVSLILAELEDAQMRPSKAGRYDVRIWGHIYALDLFSRIKKSKRFPDVDKKTEPWIKKLTETLIFEEIESGGWNYANRRAHASFVTAPAIQSLLWAREVGQKVPAVILKRAMDAMIRSNNDVGAFTYSGDATQRPTQLPGSIARSAACELTLQLLGQKRPNKIQNSIDAFHKHWNELEVRRKQHGTHVGPYKVAPYYFYYGHRFAGQAIQGLPDADKDKEFAKFRDVLMKTRDPDGTWNDRVFARSRAYGTAMSILALLRDKDLLPPKVDLSKLLMEEQKANNPKPDFVFKFGVDGSVNFQGHQQTVQQALDRFKTMRLAKPPIFEVAADPKSDPELVAQFVEKLKEQFGNGTVFVTRLD